MTPKVNICKTEHKTSKRSLQGESGYEGVVSVHILTESSLNTVGLDEGRAELRSAGQRVGHGMENQPLRELPEAFWVGMELNKLYCMREVGVLWSLGDCNVSCYDSHSTVCGQENSSVRWDGGTQVPMSPARPALIITKHLEYF